jgi:hypothetical protein
VCPCAMCLVCAVCDLYLACLRDIRKKQIAVCSQVRLCVLAYMTAKGGKTGFEAR